MSTAGWFGRSVRRDPLFDQQGASLLGSIENLERMLEGIEWILSNNPSVYPEIPGTVLRVAKSHGFDDGYMLRVFFTIDEGGTVVTLRGIDRPATT